MALRSLADLKHDDDDLYDLSKGMGDSYNPPEYPSGCCITLSGEDAERAGVSGSQVGATMRFSAMGEATSVFHSLSGGCRIELQVGEFAGEDGKFFDLEQPCYICLTSSELQKMDLDDDCESGDMIHLMGTARLESCSDTSMGQSYGLQVTDLGFVENESAESRGG